MDFVIFLIVKLKYELSNFDQDKDRDQNEDFNLTFNTKKFLL